MKTKNLVTRYEKEESIIKAFLSSESIQLNFRLDSVICLADCSNVEDMIDEQPEVKKQMALADVVLLNKSDAVQTEYVKHLKTIISEINPLAISRPVKFAQVTDFNLLDIKAFTGEAIEKSTMSFQHLHNVIETKHHHHDHHHKHEIKSMGFIIPGNFDMDKFHVWMQNFLFFNRNTIFRVKGILSFEDSPEKNIFQAIRDNYMLEKGTAWDTEPRFSKLVFIGKKLNHDKLEDNLYQLLVKPIEASK